MASLSSQEIMNVLLSHLEIILRKKGKVRTLYNCDTVIPLGTVTSHLATVYTAARGDGSKEGLQYQPWNCSIPFPVIGARWYKVTSFRSVKYYVPVLRIFDVFCCWWFFYFSCDSCEWGETQDDRRAPSPPCSNSSALATCQDRVPTFREKPFIVRTCPT